LGEKPFKIPFPLFKFHGQLDWVFLKILKPGISGSACEMNPFLNSFQYP